MREQEQFLQVLDRDEAERRFRAALDLRPAASNRSGSTRRSAACWPPTSSRPSTCRRSIARTSTASRWWPKTPSARPRKCPRAVRLEAEEIHTGIVPAGTVRPRRGGVDRHRRHDAARRRRRRDGRARRRTRRRPAHRAGRQRRQRRLVRRAPTSRRARPCCARGQLLTSRDTGVLAAIGVDRGQRLAPAGRRDPLHRRRDHRTRASRWPPAKVYDSNAQVLADAVRNWAASRSGSASRPTTPTALRAKLQQALVDGRRRAALRRHEQGRRRRVVSRGGRARRSRASSRTASRSSRASRSAWPPPAGAPSSCCPASPPRRSSRSTSSSRR